MTRVWLAMATKNIGLVLIVLDYPHTDATAWEPATRAALAVRRLCIRPVAVVSSLPELLPEGISETFLNGGVTPLHGLPEALSAIEAVANRFAPRARPPLHAAVYANPHSLAEDEAKAVLFEFGVRRPRGQVISREKLPEIDGALKEPLVLKARGLAHKSEAGAVRTQLKRDDLQQAAEGFPGDSFLVEEMVTDGVCELRVGVTHDAAHGFILTLGAGGVLTELWQDQTSMLLPVDREDVQNGIEGLRIFPLLTGYRGRACASVGAVIDAVMAVQDYVVVHAASLYEVEINPLICTSDAAIAADALILKVPEKAGELDGAD